MNFFRYPVSVKGGLVEKSRESIKGSGKCCAVTTEIVTAVFRSGPGVVMSTMLMNKVLVFRGFWIAVGAKKQHMLKKVRQTLGVHWIVEVACCNR